MRLSYQRRVMLSAGLLSLALLLLLAALWLPKLDLKVQVNDMIFVIDITDSMNVDDAKYDGTTMSRLEWAKRYVKATMLSMPCGSRAGLSAFTESRSLILIEPVEVCSNYTELTQMLAQINGSMSWARSSEVSKAVFTVIKQDRLIKPSPTVVFITDGHEAPPLNKTLYPKFRGTPGEVKGVFVGVGGQDLMPIPKTNEQGVIEGYWEPNEVMQRDVYAAGRADLDEVYANKPKTEHLSSQKKDHLESLAAMVGFEFLSSPSNPQQLIDVVNEQAGEAKREQEIKADLSPWFSMAALIALIVLYLPYQRLFKIDN